MAIPFAVPLPVICLLVMASHDIQHACVAERNLIIDASGDEVPIAVRMLFSHFLSDAMLDVAFAPCDLVRLNVNPGAGTWFSLLDGLVNRVPATIALLRLC